MFEMLNNLSVIALEVICNRIYFSALFKNRKSITQRQSYIFVLIQVIVFFGVGYIFKNNIVLREIFILLAMTGLMCLLKEGSIWKIFIAALLFMVALIALDLITLGMIYALFEQFDASDIGNTLSGRLSVIIEKSLLMLMALSVKMRSDKKQGKGLVKTEWIRFVFFPIFTIVVAMAMSVAFCKINDMRQANVLYATAFGMVLMNIFMYYLINDIIEREVGLKEREAEYAQFKNQVDIYNTMRESLERQKERAHEFKNHILCVDALAKEKKYKELEKYVSGINEALYMDRNAIDTNNEIVNTILNEKYNEMMDKGIIFVFRINDLSSIKIEDEDLVVILSNLLDNAIEACQKCEGKRTIKMKFMTENDIVILSVKNTSVGTCSIENDKIATTKRFRSEEHGIGIRNIKNAIKKYGGTYSIKSNEDEFYFAIVFPKCTKE